MADKLAFTAEGRALYMRADGTPKRPGDRVENKAMANTLAAVAEGGADVFYEGAIGQRIVADMQAHGGLMNAADLAGFRVTEGVPITVSFRGYTVSLPQPPSGGIVVGRRCASSNASTSRRWGTTRPTTSRPWAARCARR